MTDREMEFRIPLLLLVALSFIIGFLAATVMWWVATS